MALCTAACLAAAATGLAAGRYEPKLRFRALRTPHFTIYYHQGEAAMAGRLAGIAESVRENLARRTNLEAPAHAYVVLVDQSDISNGWSTPVPYNLIEIAAVPPAPSSFLGHHDDWLRIVFAHEYAHLLHLDRVGGIMKGARYVLGRNAATFPNLFVPQWQVEGFATWAESAETGFGRLHAADVDLVVEQSAAAGAIPIDRAGGGLVAWPSGYTPYFFGGRFDEAVASRSSEQALGRIARDTAGRLPFLGGGAVERATAMKPEDLWRTAFVAPAGVTAAPAGRLTRLTREGFIVTGPRLALSDPSHGDADQVVYYSAQGPHGLPEIRKVPAGGGTSSRVVSRYDGDAVSANGRWLYFDQLEYGGVSAVLADLYAFDLVSGRTRRLSHGRRLTDPDVDRAGARLVAVQAGDGGKRLVLWRINRGADGTPVLTPGPERTIGSAGCTYATPRWSPDTTRIAAVRSCLGSLPAVVEIGVDTGAERVVAADGARNVTPAWSADGRAILFSSDRQDRRFKLYGVLRGEPDGPSPAPVLLLDAPGGVMWPDVSANGRTVVFAGVTSDGYDVFLADVPDLADRLSAAAQPRPALPDVQAPPAHIPASSAADGPSAATASTAYSPWRTLVPRAWSPIVLAGAGGVDVGATAGASDALGYHAYSLGVTWRVAGERADNVFASAPASWDVAYSYNRWRPSVVLSLSSVLGTVSVAARDSRVVTTAEERTQGLFGGVVVPWRRVRVAQSWLAGVSLEERRVAAGAQVPDRRRNGVRAGWILNSARQYGYSISPEDGYRTSLNLEQVTPSLGADGEAFTFTADGRAYVSGMGAHHVLALRLAAAQSSGEARLQRVFSLGASGLPQGAFGMGSGSVGLVRGLPSDERAGPAVLAANVDYRFPILRVERGIRTWPAFLRDLHAAAFADVASAGSRLGALASPAVSVGGELASHVTLGYTWNLNVAAGVAWTHDTTRATRPDQAAVFVRTGYAF